MSPARTFRTPSQRGMALVTSLILLVIITLLALSMFRSFGTQEKVAGNLREKERALHAAENAAEYAEWWLLQGNNAAVGSSVPCSAGGITPATVTVGQICNLTLQQMNINPAQVPWTTAAGATLQQYSYQPFGMVLNATYVQSAGNPNPPYFAAPGFLITLLGNGITKAADNQGYAYQIDAYGYGSSSATVAVVESTYEIAQLLNNRGGL